MENEREKLDLLFKLWYHDQASEDQIRDLAQLIDLTSIGKQVEPLLKEQWNDQPAEQRYTTQKIGALADNILNREKRQVPGNYAGRLVWLRYAAIIILTASAGVYAWYAMQKPAVSIAVKPASGVPDILPGGNRATLVLGDGTAIGLDTAVNGQLAVQGASRIMKKAGGEIAYSARAAAGSSEVLFQQLITPRGGQYQIVLSDGTKVWLNAASSLRFPNLFTGRQRMIEVTGEVYMEVAPHANIPFIVQVNDQVKVEVLGTSFNINAYRDEAGIRTTLMEGSVRINTKTNNALLKPGQQAMVTAGISISNPVNTDGAIAWRKGVFNFEDAPFDEFMRQLARWYDLKIVYRNKIPVRLLRGDLGRNLKLSQILNVLTMFDIKYTLHDKILTIE